MLALNASLDLVSAGQWFSGFQLCSAEHFVGARVSCLPAQHVLGIIGPCYQPHTVSDTMQKRWLLHKLIVCPKIKVARNFNIIFD